MRHSVATLFLLAACKTVSGVSPELVDKLHSTPGAYLAGDVDELADFAVVNNKDFVYSVAFSPDAQRLAESRLGPKTYQLTVWSLRPRAPGSRSGALSPAARGWPGVALLARSTG